MRRFAIAALALLVGACSGEHLTAPSPTPSPTIKSLAASIDQTSIMEGGVTQAHVTAGMSDGTSKDVTTSATFSSSPSWVAAVSLSGQVTGLQAGEAMISASVSGRNASVKITVIALVVEIPWSQLSPISDSAKAAVIAHNINPYSAVTHWKDTLRIFAPETSPENKAGMVGFWELYLGEDMPPYRLVSNESEANFKVRQIWPIAGVNPGYCGWNTVTIINHVIVSSEIYYDIRPECVPGGSPLRVLAHEFGHGLGWDGHDPDGTDIMSPQGFWRANPPLVEGMRWLYKVPNGTRPI
jgi:hypothetical protein